jgi:hypothetical protein
MAAAIKKWGVGTSTLQVQELTWQTIVGRDRGKITQFQEVAGAIQEFKSSKKKAHSAPHSLTSYSRGHQ